MSSHGSHAVIQTALLLTLLLFHLAPVVARLRDAARARRSARSEVIAENHRRCADVREQADTVAGAVATETKRRLMFIRSDPSDVE